LSLSLTWSAKEMKNSIWTGSGKYLELNWHRLGEDIKIRNGPSKSVQQQQQQVFSLHFTALQVVPSSKSFEETFSIHQQTE